jgi:hypothetical protein
MMIRKCTELDLLLYKTLKNRVYMMINHLTRVNRRINNILHKANRRLIYKYLSRTGGSFDLTASSQIGEAIIAHLLMNKNFMYLEEKILASVILIIFIVLIFQIWMNLFLAKVSINRILNGHLLNKLAISLHQSVITHQQFIKIKCICLEEVQKNQKT